MKPAKHILTRRQALISLSSMGAFLLHGCKNPGPPTYGSILRMGDIFTYEAQRALLNTRALAKEYRHSDISSFPATGTTNPAKEGAMGFSKDYALLHRAGFADWKLPVTGLVARPGAYSMRQLQSLPSRRQITRHTCEEGWTAIGEWTGIPLGKLLHHAGIMPQARFVNFYSYDGWIDSVDMIDAFHPQTLLAYSMNGRPLPIQHGAPLRLRVETQIGYKSMKYLQRIEVTEQFVDTGVSDWAWHVGI